MRHLELAHRQTKKKVNWAGAVAAIAMVVGMIAIFVVVIVLPFLRAAEEAKTIGTPNYGASLSGIVLIILALITIGFLSKLLSGLTK